MNETLPHISLRLKLAFAGAGTLGLCVFILLLVLPSKGSMGLAAGLGAMVLGTLAFYLAAGRILSPIKELEEAAQHIAQENLQTAIEYRGSNEAGRLADAIRALARHVEEVTSAAEAYGRGELAASAGAGARVFAGPLAEMNRAVDEMHRLLESARKGDLGARADVSRFQGVYRELLEAVNATLGACPRISPKFPNSPGGQEIQF